MKYYGISEISKINIYGRVGIQTDSLPLLFNGSGVEVVTTGSELWIDVETDCGYFEPWVVYEINGAFMGRMMLLPGEHSICLYRSMEPSTPKCVRFYRDTPAMNDDPDIKVLVKGFKTDGEFKDVPRRPYKIEFIGDSITSGEGTYGAHDDMDWLPMYMSASINYATMTAKELNADYHLLSQGGWGVYCGWDNDIRHNIPSMYEKLCGFSRGPKFEAIETQQPYSFEWQPDAIVVNLGTNDDTAFHQPPFVDPDTKNIYCQRTNADGSYNREDLAKVQKAVVDFLYMLRKHNPNAHIVWVYGMLGYSLNLEIMEAIAKYRAESNDSNVSFLNLPNTQEDGFGSHMHPGLKSHEIASKVLTDYLKGVLPVV